MNNALAKKNPAFPNRTASPIGIFDSGVGGLTIWKEISEVLPAEHTIYVADSAYAPYGQRTPEEILERCRLITRWLLSKGCKLIVVACNTATTNAIAALRAEFPIPFIGIEPAIKPAALQSQSGKIGVLATRGTLSSALFADTSKLHASGIEIYEQEGKGLVQLIESGVTDGPQMQAHLQPLLAPMLDAGIDHLVLGCTHYPYLKPVLNELLPKEVAILDCGLPVARQTRRILEAQDLLNPANEGSSELYTNGSPEVMQQMLAKLGRTGQVYFLRYVS
ncbi:glutamate racemase [Robiginitalea myxolifaciens]|uniref:Glutamate racemase n=1 Tax=Robiginitalea myxolifaciens TaxID=400055 RepID=A0A1I6FS78_9FLAO|nr:glutamate racemase [Robiginitalea myxolifaciens]SFR32748.1 glutamate racemase [Robiginitalea myxolifaciens]